MSWINNLIVSAEYPFSQMRTLALDWVAEKRLRPLDQKIAQIQQVTAEQVQQVFWHFPLREKQVLTAYGPLNEQALCAEKPKKSQR